METMAICSFRSHKNATVGIEAFCTDCTSEIWLSDSTMQSLKDKFPENDFIKYPPKLFCIPCGMKLMETDNEIKLMETTDIQKAELAKILKK